MTIEKKYQVCYPRSHSDRNDVFKRIDAIGGWPPDKKYLSMSHASDERGCIFTDEYLRTEWWTTVVEADDYYFYKLSDKKIKEIQNKAIQDLASNLISKYRD